MNKTIAIIVSTVVAAPTLAQFDPSDSVAAFTITPSEMTVNLGETVRFDVTADAVQNQVGNNSGIGGVNVDTTVTGGLIGIG
ncbi:MAG: hypothetical protein AAGI53_16075 [Planctomycetota bacterium]